MCQPWYTAKITNFKNMLRQPENVIQHLQMIPKTLFLHTFVSYSTCKVSDNVISHTSVISSTFSCRGTNRSNCQRRDQVDIFRWRYPLHLTRPRLWKAASFATQKIRLESRYTCEQCPSKPGLALTIASVCTTARERTGNDRCMRNNIIWNFASTVTDKCMQK